MPVIKVSTQQSLDSPCAGLQHLMTNLQIPKEKIVMIDVIDPETPLLQALDTAVVAATTAPAVIRDFFTTENRTKFSTIYAEFKDRFFDKTEQPMAEMTYRKYKLLRITADGPIIAELGGETKAEGPFTAAFALIKRQPNGESGCLQTNGYANIFYVRTTKGVLCAVRIGWAGDGWVVDAIAVEDPLAWNGQHQIF